MTTRSATTKPDDVPAAPTAEATAKASSPTMSTGRRPIRSPTDPPASTSDANARL